MWYRTALFFDSLNSCGELRFRHRQRVQHLFQHLVSAQLLDLCACFRLLLFQIISYIRKTSSFLNDIYSVLFDFNRSRFLLNYIQQLTTIRIRSDRMNDGERKLSLGDVFTKALVLGILFGLTGVSSSLKHWTQTRLSGLQVHIIIAYLKVNANNIDKVGIRTVEKRMVSILPRKRHHVHTLCFPSMFRRPPALSAQQASKGHLFLSILKNRFLQRANTYCYSP